MARKNLFIYRGANAIVVDIRGASIARGILQHYDGGKTPRGYYVDCFKIQSDSIKGTSFDPETRKLCIFIDDSYLRRRE